MAGVAAIVNPLDTDEALLFTVSSARQLALEHRPLDGSNYNPYVDNGAVRGYITDSTSLAAVRHENTVTVYGITFFVDTDGKTVINIVSRLSPIYNPIASSTKTGARVGQYTSLAATGNDDTDDYVYFLQDPPGQQQSPQIIEYQYNLSIASGPTPYQRPQPDPGSKLATCWEKATGARAIFYQDYKSPQLMLCWSDDGAARPIDESNNAGMGTPLAATIVRHADGKTFDMYLYYIDNLHVLTRIVWTGAQATGSWTPPSSIKSVSPLTSKTGLAVVSDLTRSVNHIYYQTSDGTYIDQWDPFYVSKPTLHEEQRDGCE